ncbi:hypothetical protein RI129_012681 [Pyrocoelia pectoralis]|uniref:Methyltransferase type 11 domain-containing protein n=1 Tax=Pyrocoelia pectoralis TaxID=417401 RepID=A0AAN7V4A5_9COLE
MDETLKNRKPKTHWWDLNSGMRMLHQIDSLILEYIQDVLRRKNLTKNPFILDAGGEGGILAEPLARSGYTIHGIDVSKGAVEAAREHAKLDPCLNKKVSYEWESIEDHCLNNGEKYDVVILNNVLHHAKNHDENLRGCIKVLKPEGIIFVSGTNKNF